MMQIQIVYESSWRNSFLTGRDDLPIGKNNIREFKATSKAKEYDEREISFSTVMGILSRLIGDQRKLYQARAEQYDDPYYFKDIEDKISFNDKYEITYETNFVVNKSAKKIGQSSFLGVPSNEVALFFSPYAQNLWQGFNFDLNSLIEKILNNDFIFDKDLGVASPKYILQRLNIIAQMESYEFVSSRKDKLEKEIVKHEKNYLDKINAGKNPTAKELAKLDALQSELSNLNDIQVIELDKKITQVIEKLNSYFPNAEYIDRGVVYPIKLYAGCLYLFLKKLEELGIDTSKFLTKKQNITGFHPSGFNGIRDFMNPLTGGKKKTLGTPTKVTKASGILEINLDISRERAEELEQMIHDAGVSSFYLGKKGLAYVANIR